MRDYTALLNQKKGERNQVKASLEALTERLGLMQEGQINLERCQSIIQEVARLTQSQLKIQIQNLVSLALEAVFEEDAYEFDLEFCPRRNQIECDLYFVREGERIHPINASGGGVVDIAALALRISIWSLKQNRTRPIFFLDEPTAHVSSCYRENVSKLFNTLSERLGIQFIFITHDTALTEYADKTFTVKLNKGVSQIAS